MAEIQVIVYDVPRLQPYQSRLVYFNQSTEPDPEPTTPINFVARHTPAQHTLLALYRHNVAADFSFVPDQAPLTGNPHFIGRFNPVRHTVPLALRSPRSVQEFIPPPIFETNIDFIARHSPVVHNLQARFLQGAAWDDSVPLGPQPETNIDFIARHVPVKYTLRPWLMQNTAQDLTGTIQPETNTHWIARHVPVSHRILPGLRFFTPAYLGAALGPQGSTPQNYTRRFTATQFLANNAMARYALYQGAAGDLSTRPPAVLTTFAECVHLAEMIRQGEQQAARETFTDPDQSRALRNAMLAADIKYFQTVIICARQNNVIVPNVEAGLAAALKERSQIQRLH